MKTRTLAATRTTSLAPWLDYRLLAIAAFATLATFLIACGGSDDANSTNPSMPAPEPGMASGGAASEGGFAVAPEYRDSATDGAYWAGDKDDSAIPPGAYQGEVPGMGSGSTSAAFGRTIIRNGSVHLAVESVSDSFERVRQIAETAGGYVSQSDFRGSGDRQSANLTLRVPAEQFGNVIANLREIAVEVHSISSGSQDVTEEFTDLESSLRNLRAVEQQYLTQLGEASAINDILLVQDRLGSVRWEIERVQGRINMLSNLSDMATVNVSLSPEDTSVKPVEPGNGFGDKIAEAWTSSLETLGAIGTGVVVAIVWSWWLLPVVAVVAWLGRRTFLQWRERRAERALRVDTPETAA